MNCFVELVDCSTGEIYYNKNLGYAFAIGLPNDVGMSKLKELQIQAILSILTYQHHLVIQ